MHIAVLGAGVVGLATAWALVERGHDVTVVDRQPRPGLETSFGNGAQLSYAYVAPLASPSTLAKLPALLLARHAPLRIRPSLNPDFLRWSFAFLRACNARIEHETTLALLALAQLSRAETRRMTDSLGLRFGLSQSGKLVIFRGEGSFSAAKRQADVLRAAGIEQEIVSPARCLEIEPALRIVPSDLAGGIFTPSEQVGDCAMFCDALAAVLQRHPRVTWRMATVLQAPVTERGRLRAIRASTGDVEADAFVLSLATGSAALAKAAGFSMPIQSIKGYSLTVAPAAEARALERSVTDFDNKMVFAPLLAANGPKIRVAGIADLGAADIGLDESRLASIRALAGAALALHISPGDEPWAGLRPATPDSRPIIGRSPVANLLLNSGHGGLGWTLACGSARLCAELIDNAAPSLPAEAFDLSRASCR